MSERNFEMRPYGVDYVCDKCDAGLMEPHGNVAWMSSPVQYPHKCSNCGHEQAFTERYPTVRWKRGAVLGANEVTMTEPTFPELTSPAPSTTPPVQFTAEQHYAYGRQCYEAGVAAERERCAKLCAENSLREETSLGTILKPHRGPLNHDGQRYAEAIRKG